MALIVEDGTGVVDAESYLSADDWKAIADAYGWDFEQFADDEIEPALRRGTDYVEAKFRRRWPGVITYGPHGFFNLRFEDDDDNPTGKTQVLSWPRDRAIDNERRRIPETEIPKPVKLAQAWATWLEINDPNSLSPVTSTQRVLSESVAGISVTYSNSGDLIPEVNVIEEILGGIVLPTSSQQLLRF